MVPRILIIDDEADIREVTALSLETIAGWQVILAPSGAQGIRRASLEQPDAILLDVMMPDIDGPTTFQILKQNGNTAHIPVLLLTAKVQGQDRRKLDELGAAAILSKPFDPLTLADHSAHDPRCGAPGDAVVDPNVGGSWRGWNVGCNRYQSDAGFGEVAQGVARLGMIERDDSESSRIQRYFFDCGHRLFRRITVQSMNRARSNQRNARGVILNMLG